MMHIVVDGANVVGSRPDGWWRDRAGAARRLLAELEEWVAGDPVDVDDVVLVVEGKASEVAGDEPGAVRVVAAPGSGDDTIVDEAARAGDDGGSVLVVTADRGLRARIVKVGGTCEGPGWLWSRLE